MSVLDDEFSKIKAFPNGEQVAKQMFQLWDLALQPESELSSSAMRVVEVIAEHESNLLNRELRDMVHDGSVLKRFIVSMRKSSNEEWEQFKKEHEVLPIEDRDTKRLLADASGLVRNTKFKEWVLGKETLPIDPESIPVKARGLGKKEK